MIKKTPTSNLQRPTLVSGIQPTGRLHIGNYLGALKNFVDLQNSGKYECCFFIADLHALTENPNAKDLEKNIISLAADFFAAGLDQKKSTIFLQSLIPAHSELARILENIAPMGELERMTQYKDKARTQRENVNAGLFTYPVLMSADILLYDASYVPVGDDQDQHLELTRTLARKFNGRFGKTFVEPKPLHTEAPRVMSLKNPEKKMSKSDPASCLFLDDTPEEIKAKIKTAVTDSDSEIKYDPKNKAAVSNLLKIYSSLADKPIEKLEKEFSGKTYSEFKTKLAETIVEHFADYRKKKKTLSKNPALLRQTLRQGSGRAAKIAARKISEVKKKIGIAL